MTPVRARHLPLVLECMGGLGDNIYARPFVRAWAASEEGRPVWARTPWPQLFSDIPNLRFIRPTSMHLRTQLKNMERSEGLWSSPGPRADRRRMQYRLEWPGETILREIERNIGFPAKQPFVFDLPDFGPPPISGRVAVIRPATIRTEWQNPARNPHPGYLARAAQQLRLNGFKVVVVADIDGKVERADGPLPVGDVMLTNGELTAVQLMALMQHAALVVGGVGFIVPAAIALRVPAIFIGGGNGRHNAPRTVTDPRMDTTRVRWLLPDDYCMCRNMTHRCPKEISMFSERFAAAMREVAC